MNVHGIVNRVHCVRVSENNYTPTTLTLRGGPYAVDEETVISIFETVKILEIAIAEYNPLFRMSCVSN